MESTHQVFTSLFGPAYAIGACAILIALEGLFGGTAYVNAYLRVGLIEEKEDMIDRGTTLARREFRMACVGFADTLGILVASLVSSWLEPTLCGGKSGGTQYQYTILEDCKLTLQFTPLVQVDSGRNLCKEVK